MQVFELLVAKCVALKDILGHHWDLVALLLNKNFPSGLHAFHFQLLNLLFFETELFGELLYSILVYLLLSHEFLVLSFVAFEHQVKLEDFSLKLDLFVGSQRFLDVPQVQVARLGRNATWLAPASLLGLLFQDLNFVF